MKKSSVFILLLSFILSIFIISFFGLQVRDEHMKRYFTKVEFINVEVIPDTDIKIIDIELNEDDGIGYFYITYGEYYHVVPEDATDSDGYEFVIISDVPTYEDEHGNELPLVEIHANKVMFYGECAVTVMLRTTDGSSLSDTLLIVCSYPTAI